MNQAIQNKLNKADSIIQSLKRHIRCDHIEKQIVEALDLLRATIELQEKRASVSYWLGHQHKPQVVDEGPLTNSGVEKEFYNQILGQPYESTRQPEPSKTEPWPSDWPPYFHRNEPCDMLVGHCSCGTWHDAGEFTLERDGLREPYVARNLREWPSDHTGGGAYSSQCSCSACRNLRVSAQRRTDHQRQQKRKPKQSRDDDRSSELRGREFRKLMGD